MEYLKSYKLFEGKVTSDDLIKIKELCNNSLAYLLDDGFLVRVIGRMRYTRKQSRYKIYIDITKPYIKDEDENIIDKTTFKWNDIKDDVIPLLLLLKDKIGILSFLSKSDDFNKSYKEYYSVDSEYNSIIEGDDIQDTDNITSIEIELN